MRVGRWTLTDPLQPVEPSRFQRRVSERNGHSIPSIETSRGLMLALERTGFGLLTCWIQWPGVSARHRRTLTYAPTNGSQILR